MVRPAVLARALPTAPESVARARGAVVRSFAGLPDKVVEDAELLVSEAVTNSIRHSGRPADSPIHISGFLVDDTVRIEVSDEGPGPGDERSEGRLGFRIFDELATAWGTERDARRSTTWFELALG
jgi:anti-sigma regulatory factor (Ser/Thr protein kinase)